eukprot:PLAT6824.1.p1 GENE.PLAT6824.1~~PLAT6824.1.p1  ORF type:complete len:501 (-),score=142.37 PLAT6824.1:56-1498(-)
MNRAVLLLLAAAAVAAKSPRVIASWKNLDWNFRTHAERQHFLDSRLYENAMPAGVKVWHSTIFVSVPRWNPGVPATLNKLVAVPKSLASNGSHLLQPFPSWEANEVGKKDALQSVLGFQIDTCGRLWALDQGKVAGAAAKPGSIKLMVYDLTNDGKLIHHYAFPPRIASLSNSFLNDLQIDPQRRLVYITDSGIPDSPTQAPDGGLIVYNYEEDLSWRPLSAVRSTQPNFSLHLKINGDNVTFGGRPMMTGADGIALAPSGDWLYFCPLTSYHLYRVPTKMLHSPDTLAKTVNSSVELVGNKQTASDGLAMDADGRLYITSLQGSGIIRIGPHALNALNESFFQHPSYLARNVASMGWPDTIGFANDGGRMLFMSNQLYRFAKQQLNWTETNFRIWQVQADADSYLAALAPDSCNDGFSPRPATIAALVVGAVVLLAVAVWFLRRNPASTRPPRSSSELPSTSFHVLHDEEEGEGALSAK